MMNLGVLFSGGKDSVRAMMIAAEKHKIACLITIIPENPASYMFHKPACELTVIQSKALNIPIIVRKSKGEKESELADLKKVISDAKKKYKIEGIVTGAVASVYQSSRIKRICDELDLKCINPLWNVSQREHIFDVVKSGIKAVIVGVAGEGLDETFLGRIIDKELAYELTELEKKKGVHSAGEGGEYETFVIDCPMFQKRIEISEYSKVWDGSSGFVIIKGVNLVKKFS